MSWAIFFIALAVLAAVALGVVFTLRRARAAWRFLCRLLAQLREDLALVDLKTNRIEQKLNLHEPHLERLEFHAATPVALMADQASRAKRLLRAARARTGLTPAELAHLTDEELDCDAAQAFCRPAISIPSGMGDALHANRPIEAWNYAGLSASLPRAEAPQIVYLRCDGEAGAELDGADFELSVTAQPDSNWALDPGVSLQPIFYFEVDTCNSFTSPNLWRSPVLLNKAEHLADSLELSSVELDLFTVAAGSPRGESGSLRAPFPLRAMGLSTSWRDLDRYALERVARSLGEQQEPQRTIDNIFAYVFHTMIRRRAVEGLSAVDAFRARLGSCGEMNSVAAAMLEYNNIRTRTIGGFNPLVRAAYPGAGHTAIEYWHPSLDCWSYFDAYYGVHLPGVACSELASDARARSVELLHVPPELALGLDRDVLTLASLFRYRIYTDFAARAPINFLCQVANDESKYGRQWPLLDRELNLEHDSNAMQLDFDVQVRFRVAWIQGVAPAIEIPDSERKLVALSEWASCAIAIQNGSVRGGS